MPSVDEFALIRRFFQTQKTNNQHNGVILGIGDDAAICRVPVGHELVVSVDTSIIGVHFPTNTPAYDVAYKALAVNLSDMAAMGATPAWFTLALTCPAVDETWLSEFSRGLFNLAQQHKIDLIGGDTTRGQLSITIQIAGHVPQGQALRRAGAQVGDGIYVTGTLGDAGLGLQAVQQRIKLPPQYHEYCVTRLNRPTAQVAIGQVLRGIANSAIDISDGLSADLNHILTASQVGADLNLAQLPLSTAVRQSITTQQAQQLALTAGDDYELCFSVPADKQALLDKALAGKQYQRIGTIRRETGLSIGQQTALSPVGYHHF